MGGTKHKIGKQVVSVRVTRPHRVITALTPLEFQRLQLFSALCCSASEFVREAINFYMGYLEGCNDTQELQKLQDGLDDIKKADQREMKARLAEKKAKLLEQELINKKKFWAWQNTLKGTRKPEGERGKGKKKLGRPFGSPNRKK